MARLPEPERDKLTDSGKQIFDVIDSTRGGVWGPYAVLMHVPPLAKRIASVGEYLRFQGTLPADEREVAILTAAQRSGSEFEWSKHEPIARESGVTEEGLRSIKAAAVPNDLSHRQRLIVHAVRELFDTRTLSDGTFADCHSEFGTEALIEVVAIAGFYKLLAFILQTFDITTADS